MVKLPSGDLLANLLREIPAVLYVSSQSNECIYVSESIQSLLGFSADEWRNDPDLWKRQIHPDDLLVRTEMEREQQTSISFAGEYRLRRKDGQEIWVRDESHRTKDGHRYGVLIAIKSGDDPDSARNRSRLEQRIKSLQRFEAIGSLAAGVAHEFNNLLMAISAHCDVIKSRSGDSAPPELGEIQHAADEGSALTRQLLAFGGKQIRRPEKIHLNQTLNDLNPVFSKLLPQNIRLNLALATDLGVFEADPTQIEDLFMNLILVAHDAMPEGGMISIETSNVQIQSEDLQDRTNMKTGPYIYVSVSDTGRGMDADAREHVFEPFYRRKDGTVAGGLRLPGIYGAVKQNEGYVWVYGDPGKGTTFKIYFPRANGVPDDAPMSAVAEAKSTGVGKTILVVDDNDAVRTAIATYLEMSGFEVMSAADGKKAIELSESEGSKRIDLLITDLVMPSIGGIELSQHLLELNAKMKVLFMSGYTEESLVRKGNLPEGESFLSKPASMQVVLKKVKELLNT